ncbi:response regulator [Rufibacter hautae]|uniref:Response regulator n=1 Tax=Rufibacter hautae TaxID=2595005 RepID=A0A5B6TDU5_9BACT|nr:response regulator [Rufibacter hautae]KAA3437101.1 response regulator [Rufibacter hautae]
MKRFKKVLLVDSDPISAYLSTILMQQAGFTEEINAADSGEQAHEMLLRCCATPEEAAACPDLILLDPYLVDMDGFEFLEACRQLPLTPKIVLLSNAKPRQYAEQAKGLGPFDYLLKPLTAEALDLIRKLAKSKV